MKLRPVLLTAVVGVFVTLLALAPPGGQGLLVHEWAAKGDRRVPPVAVLIELGLKDAQATSWAGKAAVTGATVVHREGYAFRADDKLTDPDGWQASSHKAGAAAKKKKAADGAVPVGVVLHLADVKPDATLTVTAGQGREPAAVPLAGVLAGKAQLLWNGAAAVRLVSTATPVAKGKTEDDFPAAAYGPDGTLWVAYVSYTLKEEDRRVAPPQLKAHPADFKSYFTPEFADRLKVVACRDGKWDKPIDVTDGRQDLVGCAVAAEAGGTVWAVYSAHRNGRHALLARPITGGADPTPGPEETIAAAAERHVHPVACTDRSGAVRVLCQTWGPDGKTVLSSWTRAGGAWKPGPTTAGPGRVWQPALSAGPNGEVAAAGDCYRDGDYDVLLTTDTGGKPAELAVASSASFEARPALAYDGRGRLWVAYEYGPENWGKDFGPFDEGDGNPLYFNRTVRVACVQDGKLMRPAAELPGMGQRDKLEVAMTAIERNTRYSHPQVGVDGKGRVWLTYLQKFGNRATTRLGSYWLVVARRLEGDRWSDPIEVHHSDGMMDARPVLLPHPAGGLRVIHHADDRHTAPTEIGTRVYESYIDLPGDPPEPKLVPHDPGTKGEKAVARGKAEREAVERIRAYRVEAAGKTYRLLRGEFHRHTEISGDGGADGSLGDMFRYGADCAAMDWIATTDHDNGNGREYTWWLTQKMADAYHVAGQFTPMFGYERSVPYPHGHRNVLFAKRGVRTLPRLAPPNFAQAVAGIHADDAKMLYRYLHELGGICASHTTATTMGTDWRDNDPVVEPVVEIYQGDRNSYEFQGAPRTGHDPELGRKPAQIAGWHPDGFIDIALGQKGYKFGFQSSSDHLSTHISYCVVLAERHDREAILDGLRKRHCYGATDDIVLDVRSGDKVMGDEFKTAAAPKLEIRVVGTAAIQAVDVVRDSKVVATLTANGREYKGEWTDPAPAAGRHYYYVRVTQADGELAWGSPMWIEVGR
jgi:hypothetical protein